MTTHPTSAPQTDALLGVYKKPPMEFVRGAGVYLYDADGKGYLDFVAGIAVNALGYGDPGVDAAMREAMATGILHTSNLYRTAPGEQLADKLVARTFADRVFFSNSGAEANEGLYKLARKFGHDKGITNPQIVVYEKAFHGRSIATLSATGNPKVQAGFGPLVVRPPAHPISLAVLAQLRHGAGEAVHGGARRLHAARLRSLGAVIQRREPHVPRST